jgi:hypothetical protein
MSKVKGSAQPKHEVIQLSDDLRMGRDIKRGFGRPTKRRMLSKPNVTIDDVFAYAALIGISGTVIYAVRGNSKVTLISIILNIFFGLYFITKKFK